MAAIRIGEAASKFCQSKDTWGKIELVVITHGINLVMENFHAKSKAHK